MLRHSIIYALRRLGKNQLYTGLNLFGLSIGLACFAVIGLWIRWELSYDKFHAKSDRIYRIAARYIDETSSNDVAVTGFPLAPLLLKDIPDIEYAVRLDPCDNPMMVGDKKFLEQGIIAEQSFFDVFDFPILQGNRTTLLSEPYSVVLTDALALKYFGDTDPIGQFMTVFRFDPNGNGSQFKVTGVVKETPENSHFRFDFILSGKTAEVYNPAINQTQSILGGSYYTYVVLHHRVDPVSVESKFPQILETYAGKMMQDRNLRLEYSLQPLTDIHLRSTLAYDIGQQGSITYVLIFATVGIIVLLLACINYVNLSTAYSSERFKEVGMHKVMGAQKGQLIARYLTESWLLAMFSLVVALGWIELARPLLEGIAQTAIPGLYNFDSIATLVTITSLVGILAGLYPSFVLSSFKPVNALKRQHGNVSGGGLRKVLVVVQFSMTIILVIGIMVVQLQMNFVQDKDLGFDKNNLVVFGVHGDATVQAGYQAFVDEVTQSPNVAGVARSNTTIGNGLDYATATLKDESGQEVGRSVYRLRVDYNYFDVYKMELLAGRNFRPDNGSDSTRAFVVNEELIHQYGYTDPNDVIGKSIGFNGVEGQIIGVLKDFNFASLQHKVDPVAIWLLNKGFSRISIRVEGDTRKGFEEVTALWKKHFPSAIIQYAFYEDSLATSYRTEQRFSGIFLVFSTISLAIACLGLFALVSYTVERRAKEIGIRKVLGASIVNILSMISAQFVWLVAFSCLVAIPVGYYFMNEWLTGFAYHISLNAFMFGGAGLIVLVVAWGTVTLRTFSAASANPVNSLRSE
ncbi:MAG TPA: ABC transporter permease [Cyclobacteriaceae bacterium]|nr:ABC transporter permease [Cyclobacteriaceae bacterium]